MADKDPSGLPTYKGSPVLPGEENIIKDRWQCRHCIYCRGKFSRGFEVYPLFCWHYDPEAPPPPQPVDGYQSACVYFVKAVRLAANERINPTYVLDNLSLPGRLVYDGETFYSQTYIRYGSEDEEELRFLKGHQPE